MGKVLNIGIALPASGEYIEFEGTPFFFIELGYTGMAVGELSPAHKKIRKWRIIRVPEDL